MKSAAFLLILPLVMWAQPEFFGYYESEADVIQVASSSYNFGYNKFRLDVEARPNDHVLIGANINIQQYWGQTTWNLLDFLPESVWKPIFQNEHVPQEYWVEDLPYTLPDTLLLDNLYMRVSFPFLDLTLGRQQISSGVSYAWNPTDIFNTKTLLDPSYEQTGVNAIRAELPVAERLTMNVIVQPEDQWDNSAKQVFLKAGLGSFDFELTAAEYEWSRSSVFGAEIVEVQTHRTMIGGNIVGELLGWGFWTEATHNKLTGGDDFDEVVIGADHTFDNSIYLLMEVLHNGQGTADKADLTFNNFLQSFGGETRSLMQDYGFLYLNHPTFDYVTLSAIAIINFNDQSGSVGPQIDWNVFEDTNISLQGSYFPGKADTEFGLQDWGLRLRFRSSF